MGNLVDTFIMCPKEEWRDDVMISIGIIIKDNHKIKEAIPEKYREMFVIVITALLEFDEYFSINDIFSQSRNLDLLGKIEDALESRGYVFSSFSHRYRGECLLQIMRKTFYNTLLIVQNDYDPNKLNKFIILAGDDVIPEETWEKEESHEQTFSKRVALDLADAGYTIIDNT